MGKRGVETIGYDYKEPQILAKEIVELKDCKLRDRALIAMLCMTGLRISELLSLVKEQIDLETDEEFIIIKRYLVLKKYTKITKDQDVIETKRRFIYNDIAIRKEGVYADLVKIMLEYLQTLKPRQIYLFTICRSRAWQIVKRHTGYWPHYYRSQRMSYLVNTLKGAGDAAGKIMKVVPRTISHYYKGAWKDHRDELK